MTEGEDKVEAAIADEAGERFVSNDAGPLGEGDASALAAWLKASPAHVGEFLGVSVIARDLKELHEDPAYSVEAMLREARLEDTGTVEPLRRVGAARRGMPARRWQIAAIAATVMVAFVGLLAWWNLRPPSPSSASKGVTALHFATRHGEQLSRVLPDNSVLYLNTDSAVTVRFGHTERLVSLDRGQASFEVAHEPHRAFRVLAGGAEVIAVGTKFDVRRENDASLVTVIEGRVAVGPSSDNTRSPRFVEVGADQQATLVEGQWPPTILAVDSKQPTAWLHRQIAFDNEPLERVAAEFNRYAPKPIEIATPSLRGLKISGVFATDDPDAFIAFLRSLKGVRVEVTTEHIRVSGD
jgi:transmembrane sensor